VIHARRLAEKRYKYTANESPRLARGMGRET